MNRGVIAFVALALSACAGSARVRADQSAPSTRVSPGAAIARAPEPVTIAGQRVAVYELVIDNPTNEPVALSSLAINAGAFGSPTLRGEALLSRARLLYEGDASGGQDLRTLLRRQVTRMTAGRIPPARQAAVFLWLTAPAGAPTPGVIAHELTLETSRGPLVLHAATRPLDRAPIVLDPPLRGAGWIAANGLADGEGHVRTFIPAGGRQWLAQRFAADFQRAGPDGRVLRAGATRADNTAHYGYGAEVVAVADATVVRVRDGIAENSGSQYAVPITIETVTGNAVFLDLGDERYAFYAHLQPGSIRVREGERVRRGQVLARVGNSGNSTGPHMHFHVCTRPTGLECEGVPYVLRGFEATPAAPEGDGEPETTRIRATGPAQRVQGEMPTPGALLTFGDDAAAPNAP